MDGYYSNDGDGHIFVVAFFKGSDGDYAYIYDGEAEAFDKCTVDNMVSHEFGDYYLVTVGNLELSYYYDGDGTPWIMDGDIFYAANSLSEEDANEFIKDMME